MQGMMTVFWKELADDLTSKRFLILFLVVLLAVVFPIFISFQAIDAIKEAVTTGTQFVFLMLFSPPIDLPFFLNFIFLVSILVPLIGIALGFDAINSEKNNGTLSRLISQPVYRDAVINGKFLAGAITIGIMLTSIVLLVSGIGINILGVAPSAEEILRLMAFLAIGTIYGAFWLGLAMLFSIFFSRVATSSLASMAVWLFFFFYVLMFAGIIANLFAPLDGTQFSEVKNAEFQLLLLRLSPIHLFQESTAFILGPEAITKVQFLQIRAQAASDFFTPAPLSFGQSLLAVWPHVMSLIALTVITFAASYTKFMRMEIRST